MIEDSLVTAVIAVDGGGSSCRVALQTPRARHVAELGPANATTDFEQTVATIREGLKAVAAEAGLPLAALESVPAYLGVAGVVSAAIAERLGAALPLGHTHIEDDRRAAALGALGGRDGAVAGLRTGSFFVTQQAGKLRFAGGWGSRLGDVGSGYWIGREALARTLDVHDGLLDPSGLTQTLTGRHGGEPGEIVGFSRRAAPRDFAALAPLVVEAAAAGDPVAGGILKGGAIYIADTLHLMGWRRGQPLCLVGAIAQHYAHFLPLAMEASLVEPLGTPLDGAVALARELRDARDRAG